MTTQLITEVESQSSTTLAVALLALCGKNELDEAERMVRRAIVATLYDRHPEIVAAYDAWIDSDSAEDVETVIAGTALAL